MARTQVRLVSSVLCLALAFTAAQAAGKRASMESVDDDDEIRLTADLFRDYKPNIRPVENKTDNITLKFGLSVHQIIAVDFKNQIVKSSVWIRQNWTNPFLVWNTSDYGGISRINVDANKVWVPDLYLYNNADETYDGGMDKFKTKVVLYSDGVALWLAPKIISSSCRFDVTYFPFDEQQCNLKFGSWTYDGHSLNLIYEDFPNSCDGDISKFIPNGEWDLKAMPCQRNVIKYVCCPGPYPDVTYTLSMRRKPMFYFVNMIAPCFLITALTLLSFYLPAESGERLTLVITNLLALTVFMLLVVDMIPATSETVPFISVYFYGSVFEVALALIATCVVLRCHFNPSQRPVPLWVKHLVLGGLARILRVNVRDVADDTAQVAKKPTRKPSDAAATHYADEKPLKLPDNRPTREHAQFALPPGAPYGSHARELESTLPLIACRKEGSFPSPTKHMRSTSVPHGGPANGVPAVAIDDVDERRNLVTRRRHESPNTSPQPSRASSEVNVKSECCGRHPKTPLDSGIEASILQYNRTLTSRVDELVGYAREQQEAERQMDDWHMVALVIDKFCLLIFIVLVLSSTAALFMQAPSYVFA